MSKANRTNRPNEKKVSRTRFLRSRSRLLFLSKPVIQNPKWDPESQLNTEPQFIVAPVKGRSYNKAEANAIAARKAAEASAHDNA